MLLDEQAPSEDHRSLPFGDRSSPKDGSPQHFDGIVLTLGYPKADDLSKRIERPWHGFEIKRITHPLFGKLPVRVFAIKVN